MQPVTADGIHTNKQVNAIDARSGFCGSCCIGVVCDQLGADYALMLVHVACTYRTLPTGPVLVMKTYRVWSE